MAKQKVGGNAKGEKFVGVSTSQDVKAFRSANTSLTARVTSSKAAARTYVQALEQRAGISGKKK